MKLITTLLWFVPLAQSKELLQRATCKADNCARAVTGTVGGAQRSSSRRADCSSFERYTFYPPALTLTQSGPSAATIQPTGPVNTIVKPSTVPPYAQSSCGPPASASSRFASACSCAGVSTTITTAPSPTATVIVTTSPACSTYIFMSDSEEFLYYNTSPYGTSLELTDTGSNVDEGIKQATRFVVGSDHIVRLASNLDYVWIAEGDDDAPVGIDRAVAFGDNYLYLETDGYSGAYPDDPKSTYLSAAHGPQGDWQLGLVKLGYSPNLQKVVYGVYAKSIYTNDPNFESFGVYAFNSCDT